MINKGEYEFFIPIGASSVDFVNRNREKLSKYVGVFLPSSTTIEKCLHSKIEIIRLVESYGIRVPFTYYFIDYEDYQRCKKDIRFPVVVKSNSEIYKKNPVYCRNLGDLDRVIIDYYNSFNCLPLIQEYIRGKGVGFFSLYNNGCLLQFFMHMRLRENPASGGPSSCALSIYDEKLYLSGKKILDGLNWHGVAIVLGFT